MNFDDLIEIFADQPFIESASLVTLAGDAAAARVQISRWVASGHLMQLRRGYYLHAPSYISLDYALSHYGLIPEAALTITSVTTKRPAVIATPIGRFAYRHIAPQHFWGTEMHEPRGLTPVQMALPEKALLDLLYLTPGRVGATLLESLRLQHLDTLDLSRLQGFAKRFGGPKMLRAAEEIERYSIETEGMGR